MDIRAIVDEARARKAELVNGGLESEDFDEALAFLQSLLDRKKG